MDRIRIPSHILDDLCSRFILAMPDDYSHDMIRIFFQLELAHWFYIDFLVPENPELKKVGIRDFAILMFKRFPFLLKDSDEVDALHQDWRTYKYAVPTYGAILLDPSLTYTLLVLSYARNWSFPKGKVNEEEGPEKCAIREVLEETNYDITPLLNPEHYVEYSVGEQQSRLYIIAGVSLETPFICATRNEIRDFQWFPIHLLPTSKKDVSHKDILGFGPNSFFMVIPFLKPLKKWIAQQTDTAYDSKGTPKSPPKSSDRRPVAQDELAKHLQHADDASGGSPAFMEKRYEGARVSAEKGNHSAYKQGLGAPADNKQQQFTILKREVHKDKSPTGKSSKTRKSLDAAFSSSGQAQSPLTRDHNEEPIKLCKAWQSFKLDMPAIMMAAGLTR